MFKLKETRYNVDNNERKDGFTMGLEELIAGYREQATAEKPTVCPKCNIEYRYMGLGHYECPECGEVVTDDYGKIRDYVESSAEDVGIEKASADTGVSVERIKELIEMGKLSLTSGKK